MTSFQTTVTAGKCLQPSPLRFMLLLTGTLMPGFTQRAAQKLGPDFRMGIANNLAEIAENFEVYGLKNGEWIKFTTNVNYDAFLVRRK